MDEIELYKRASELERKKADSKEFIRDKRVQFQTEMAGMSDLVVSALFSLLTNEDPAVRIKAVSLWMAKMVPTVAPEKIEEDSAIDVGAAGFDDIAAQIDELKRKAAE